jgi:signal transduction histidine kinase
MRNPVPAALVAIMLVVLTGCSRGPANAEEAWASFSTQVTDARAAVGDAVLASFEYARGFGEEQTALTKIQAADASLSAISASASDLPPDAEIPTMVTAFTTTGSSIVALLLQGQNDQADRLQQTTFSTAADNLAAAVADRRRSVASTPGTPANGASGGSTLPRVILVAALGVGMTFAAAMSLTRRRARPTHPAPPRPVAAESPVGPNSRGERRRRKGRHATDRLNTPRQPVPTTVGPPPSGQETSRAARRRAMTTELKGVIEASLASISDTGWDAAIECPSVGVLVDPILLRRVLANLLQSANAHGAENIGIVTQVEGDRVKVSIGDDGDVGPPSPGSEWRIGTAEPVSAEVEHQLTVSRQLLQGMDAKVTWSRMGEISLYTVDLKRSQA